MSIIRRQRVTWTSVDNSIITDHRLGLKALGLLVYMLSKPNDWEFNQEQLGDAWGEGRDAMRSVMRKLTECGYVRREYARDALGHIRTVTIVSELPSGDSDDRQNRTTGNPSVGQPVSIVNTDKDKGLKVQKTEGATEKFILPEWIDREAWKGYEEMRAKLKKPLTDRARMLAVRDLEKLRDAGHDAAAVLDQSTQNGWQGLFEIKSKSATAHGRRDQQPHQSVDELVRGVLELRAERERGGSGGFLPNPVDGGFENFGGDLG